MSAHVAVTEAAAKPPAGLFATALRDAAGAAAVTFGLLVLVVGFRTVTGGGAMALEFRPALLAYCVAAVFAASLLINLTIGRKDVRDAISDAVPAGVNKGLALLGRLLPPLLLAYAVAMPFLPFTERADINLGIQILIYVMLGWGLNIVVGLAGLLDLGYVAFYAVGAYSYALLAQHFGFSFWLCLPLAGVLAAFWGILLGFPVLRLRGDYLAIVTVAFGEIIRILLLNLTDLTGGPNGIGGIPYPTFFGLDFKNDETGFAAFFGLEYATIHRNMFLYFLILTLALITNFATIRLRRLPVGRAWEAMRENEIACRSLGINVTNTKLTAFAIGAMFAGFAGSFFATNQRFISPESFTFQESALVLAIVVLGGMGSQLGIALAAIILTVFYEYFRVFGEYRMLFVGAAMVLMMRVRPRGLISSRAPTVFLKHKTVISGDYVKEGHG